MLQRQQPLEVYKLATLRPCQSSCVAHGLTKQEHAGTGGRAAKFVCNIGQSCPVIAKEPTNLLQVRARLLGEFLMDSHGFHPVVTLRQDGSFKTPNFSFPKAIWPGPL